MGGLLQRDNRTRATPLCQPTTAPATADLQPIDSIHCASSARDSRFTGTAKRRSEICIRHAFGRKSSSCGRSLSPTAGDIYGDIPRYCRRTWGCMSAVRMGGVWCIRDRKQMQCRVESSFTSMRVHREIKREIGKPAAAGDV
jgi:hypothetical protein